jgi:hypothetical protein
MKRKRKSQQSVKSVIKAEDKILAFLIEPVLNQIMEEKEFIQPEANPLKPSPSMKEIKKQYRDFVSEHLYMRKDRIRTREGMEVIFNNLHRVHNQELCRKELKQMGVKMEELFVAPIIGKEKETIEELKAFKPGSLQEVGEEVDESAALDDIVPLMSEVDVSHEVFNSFYEIGCRLFEESSFKNAAAVFHCLTLLDVRCHEAWFSQALCFHRLKEWVNAIANYSMASVTDSSNITTFLNLARCYEAIHDIDNMEYTLLLAKELLEQIEIGEKKKEAFKQAIKEFHGKNGGDV